MATWPTSIENCSTHSFSVTKGLHKSKFENGFVYTRALHTKERRKFNVSWDNMTEDNMNSLIDFFASNLAATFVWNNPTLDTNYTVRFANDTIEVDYTGYGSYWKVGIELEEV